MGESDHMQQTIYYQSKEKAFDMGANRQPCFYSFQSL